MRGGVLIALGRGYRWAAIAGRRAIASARWPIGSDDRPHDLHEWICFEDPTEQRTWVFDATFLRSNYRCIYGDGCQGVLDADATELEQGCCSYGAHFVDDDDVADVVERVRAADAATRCSSTPRPRRGGFLRPGEPDDDGASRRSPGWSTTPASSSTGPVRRRGRAARCTSPRSRPASGRSTGSPTSAGRCRCGSSTRPTRTATSRHAAGVEAPRLGRGRRRVPLVVHRVARGVRRRPSRSTQESRDEIVELVGQERLRPDGRTARAATMDACRTRRCGAERRGRSASPSVVVVGVLVELDAVLLGEGGVLFVLLGCARRRALATTIAEPEIERSRDRTASACALPRSGDDDPSSRRAPKLES